VPKLAILDGHSLAYRAFYALPADLATPAGQVTNAVFGFTSMLIKLLEDEHPDAVAVAWDTPEQTFRAEEYDGYKAQREAAPDLFRSQLPLVKDVLSVLRVEQLEMPGYEADDVIATLADRSAAQGWDVVIVTGDRDAFQLIDDHVTVLYTRRGMSDLVLADARWVEQRYGVPPDRYVDYAALRGDPSDNLPGVPGVGEKTAAKLVSGYGNLEGIYEHLEEQTPKLRKNLAASREQVFLNRRLMTLVADVDVSAAPDDLRLQAWDWEETRHVFDALAFRSLWPRLQQAAGITAPTGREVADVSVRVERGRAAIAALAGGGRLIVEPVYDGDFAGIMVAETESEAVFVPHDCLQALGAGLADASVPKVAHDAKRLMRELLVMDIDFHGLEFDTALAAYLVNPAQQIPDLAGLALRELGVLVTDEGAAAGGGGGQGSFDFAGDDGPDLEDAARRVTVIAALEHRLREQLGARGGTALYKEVELPLVRVLARMEHAGIAIDTPYLRQLGDDLRRRLAVLEQDIHDAAGGPFNVNSASQLREVLFERLGLPVVKKTPKGAPSTDASVLAKLVDEHPVVAALLQYRELEKLRSTYVDGLLPLVDSDGRIRAVFNQTGAATGRLSSERPNLQNIPIRREEGRAIRRAFVAEPGAAFIVADYSQIELRILAHLSRDPGLLEAFAGDQDIHRATAARVFGMEPEAVTPEMRRRAKAINFGLLYGMEAYGLAQRLGIDRTEAEEHITAYFDQFPSVRAFMEGVVADARASGFTTTILGRRRYLPELASGNFRDRQMGERMALNAPIQGSAADIIKKAMVTLDGEFESRGDGTAMLLQIHDELVVEAPEQSVDAVIDVTRRVMESVVELAIPMRVDIATGPDLASCKP
jgi:DNA polymerase-1